MQRGGHPAANTSSGCWPGPRFEATIGTPPETAISRPHPEAPRPVAATPNSVSPPSDPQISLPEVIRTRRLKVAPSRTIAMPKHRWRMSSAGLTGTKLASEPCDTIMPYTNSTK